MILVHLATSEDLKEQVDGILEQNPCLPLFVVDELHVSLFCGHFKLRVHQIQPFINDLKTRVGKIPSFKLVLNRIQILSNDDESRSFICLKVDPRYKNLSLDRLINEIENCLQDFEREGSSRETYDDPFITHCSLIWFQGSDSDGDRILDKKSLSTLIGSIEQEFEEDPLILDVKNITVKAGNQTFIVSLLKSS